MSHLVDALSLAHPSNFKASKGNGPDATSTTGERRRAMTSIQNTNSDRQGDAMNSGRANDVTTMAQHQEPQRRPRGPLFWLKRGLLGLGIGLVALAVIGAIYLISYNQTSSTAERQEEDIALEEPDKNEQQAEAPASELPDYNVTLELECPQGNIPAKCYSVTTAATSEEEDLRALTEYFRDENPQAMAIAIAFYPPGQTAEISGVAEWFVNEEAARVLLAPSYMDSDIQEIIDDGGMLVVSVKDTLDEMTTKTCAEGDVTTMGSPGPGSCQVLRTGYPVSGRLHVRLDVRMDHGTEEEFDPGDANVIPPGHNARVEGDEPVVSVDMSSVRAERYAKGE